MNAELLNLFAEYMEKQEVLSRLTEDERLHGFSYSEIHTIAAIGDLEEPNVTNIADRMSVTRGAISKITKRLQGQGLIEPYRRGGNKQKVFFQLTESGRVLYDEHEKRHELWLKRDDAFLAQFGAETVGQVESFMRAFNEYLETQITELGGNGHEG